MSGGTKETTTNQNVDAEPWKAAQPGIKLGMSDAMDLYKSGTGFQPYTGSTVVPFSDQTTAGMKDIQKNATNAMDGPNAFDRGFSSLDNLITSGGLTGDMKTIGDMWMKTAKGDELATSSPVFENVLKKMEDDAATQVNMAMSGRGRYGSGSHTDVLASTVGDVANRARLEEYNREKARMDAARGNVANLGQQGINNRMSATAALPGAWEARSAPAKDMMSIGSMYEDLMGRTMADNMRIFDETQKAPLQAVEWLNAIMSGNGSLGGSTTGKTSTLTPAPNPFLTIGAAALGANRLTGNPIGSFF